MELLALLARVILSLVVVLVLLWLAARGLRKNQRRSLQGIEVEVLARQPLAQRSSLAVVQVGERALVLGVTESRVELLTEASLDSLLSAAAPGTPTLAVVGSDVPDGRIDSGLHDAVGGSAQEVAAVTALVRGNGRRPMTPPQRGGLSGSALSPATWAKAVDAVREMTVRR